MMHKAWSSIEEVPYCFARSSVKFQGHTALKIVEFDPNWAFPDCNSSLNSPMAMKCCTQLETAKERCTIVFQGHPSNFKVTRNKTSPILTQIGRFRTIGLSQLSNPSDLPCYHSGRYLRDTCLREIKTARTDMLYMLYVGVHGSYLIVRRAQKWYLNAPKVNVHGSACIVWKDWGSFVSHPMSCTRINVPLSCKHAIGRQNNIVVQGIWGL